MKTRITTAIATALILGGTALSDQIVQDGNLSGGIGDPILHDVVLARFDTLGGTRQLNFVQIDYLTSVIGGGQGEGSGTPVHLFAQLDANYSLGEDPLADTQALIDFIHPNNSQNSFTLFDTDTAQVVLDQPDDMAPWIGRGDIIMSAWTQFILWADPPDLIDFSAGGTVSYTVTYDYDEVVAIPGDVNGDGVVDVVDVLALLSAWGDCGDCADCSADFDGDCIVGVSDLLVILGAWT